MSGALPIRFQELFQLRALGVNPQSISFLTLSLESEKFVCVREQAPPGGQGQVLVVDTANPSDPLRFPTTCDGALMNPTERILALKAGRQLQIFNLDARERLKDCTVPEDVVFWKWISSNTLALVTARAVFHWSLDGADQPYKMFDRHPSLNGTQIINYRGDAANKWFTLIGISQKDGRVVGAMQLYSVERKLSQPIEGHAAGFATYRVPGATKDSTLFCFASRSTTSKLYVIEVGGDDNTTGPKFEKRAVDMFFPAEAAGDFPVAIQVSERFKVIYMITKFGYIHVFSLSSGELIYLNRISSETIFVTSPHEASGGIIGVNRLGQVLLITLNDETVINYLVQQNKLDLAIQLASDAGLPGADNLFSQQFARLFQSGDLRGAAAVAARSPGTTLRNMQTIQRFQSLPQVAGQPAPVLQYLGVLIENTILNQIESLELARQVIAQQRIQLLEKWLGEEKLTPSEELGDLLRPHNAQLALGVYLRSEVHGKVVSCLAELGQFDKIVEYTGRTGFQPDWSFLLQQVIPINPTGAVNLATMLLQKEPPLVDINLVVDAFVQRNMVKEVTSLLIDVLKGNNPEDGPLQTRLLEINLIQAPQVADAILGNEMFTHYDRVRVAQLCEKAGLYQRALEHYTELTDIKRVMMNTHAIQPEFLLNYFSTLSVEDSIECMRELLRGNIRQNLQVVVQVAVKYSEQITATSLIQLFEEFKSFEGLFLYLQQVLSFTEDPEVHYRYIEAAARTGQFAEVERVCRESNHYDPQRVKEFLKDARLSDQLPLIIVCDRFDMVDDMTHYLYNNNLSKYIEAYVQRINPINTPAVVGALLDVDCNEDYIKNLMRSVRNMAPIEELVDACEKRNRLKLLRGWLEERVAEGNSEPSTHNALAKIIIDANQDAEKFLLENKFYDSRIVGKYCENRDPHLAFVAYKRGLCDHELVDVTNRNGLFKNQARYLVQRQDQDLWEHVLKEENEHRRSLIDQVVSTALPECHSPDEVSSAVKAFMTADLPNELIELLEKIVLETGEFSGNRNLQNLLILTAIRADKERVMDYIKRLDNFDAPDIANIAVGSELYEEAFVIFKKFNHNVQAIEVLVDHLQSLQRAHDFAERVNEPDVWSKLARAQLDQGLIKESIDSYIKANDHGNSAAVIAAARESESYEDLVRYLNMCRKRVKEAKIESELIYAYAKVGKLGDMEEFINGPNCAHIQDIGDRCYDEGLFEAAKLLYNNVSNFARLAAALVKLGEFSAAVDAARKANSTRSWKDVLKASVDAGEFRLAQVCGLHIIIHGDELEELIQYYEVRGHTEQLMGLLEGGLGLERAHVGMFTELAILYSKYAIEKLMEHLKLFYSRINIPKVLRACEANHQYDALTFLYIHYDEFDNAALTMINHSVDAWEHVLFKEVIQKVSNIDVIYRAVQFYLEEHPMQTNDLLNTLSGKLEIGRVIALVRRMGHLPVIKPFLQAAQEQNVPACNEALNELYIEEEDYEALRQSIEEYDEFDSLALAQSIENHELLEFRRIAAALYKKAGRHDKSAEISKKDQLWQDVIQTAAESSSYDQTEELLRYFAENGMKECFAAALYTCYDSVKPDLALELGWRYKMLDFSFPYLVQFVREYSEKVDKLVEAEAERQAKAEEVSGFQPPASNDPSVVGMVVPQQQFGAPPPMSMPMQQQQPMQSMPGMQAAMPNTMGMVPQQQMAPMSMGAVPGSIQPQPQPQFNAVPAMGGFNAQPQFPQQPNSFGGF